MSRPRVSRADVIEVAEAIVDQHGWDGLTVSAVADKLGVRGPSVYSHVDGLDELLGLVQTRALEDLGDRLQRASMGRSRAEGVRALAGALREFAARHPGRYELAMLEPIDRPAMVAAGRRAGEALGAVVASFGVDDMTHELSFSCLATLHGVLALDRAGLYRASTVDVDAAYTTATDLVVQLVEAAACG